MKMNDGMHAFGRRAAPAETRGRQRGRVAIGRPVADEPASVCVDAVLQMKRVHDLRENRRRRMEVELARLARLMQTASENLERTCMGLADARTTRQSREAALAERYSGRCLSVEQTSVWREGLRAQIEKVRAAETAYREAASAIEQCRLQFDEAQMDYQRMLKKLEKTDQLQAWLQEETEL
jgi:hypothetical protein